MANNPTPTPKGKITTADLNKLLTDFLNDGADWEEMPVSLKGNVKIKILPKTKTAPARLGLTFNPNAVKKDTYFFDTAKYINFLNCMTESAEGCLKILKIIEKLNGKVAKTTVREGIVI
jgi:hypothetical protein